MSFNKIFFNFAQIVPQRVQRNIFSSELIAENNQRIVFDHADYEFEKIH